MISILNAYAGVIAVVTIGIGLLLGRREQATWRGTHPSTRDIGDAS